MEPIAQQQDTPAWFVLNHIGPSLQDAAKKEVERFNRWQNLDIELFAPTYVVREEHGGQVRMRTANLTFHYVFVRGSLGQVKMLCSQTNGFSFVIDRGSDSRRYAVITDRDMANFKNIARAYRNCLPYFPLDQIDLEEGDLVEVIDGEFSGLIGTYIPRPRSTAGNILLNVYNNVGTIAFNVKAAHVRVIEFSSRATRANDQIDAFVPHLLAALPFYRAEEALPAALAAKLSVFCSRMEVARLGNRKLQAKLHILLAAANHILGNIDAARTARAAYERTKTAITNPWTATLAALLTATLDDTPLPPLPDTPPSSHLQNLLTQCIIHLCTVAPWSNVAKLRE